MQNEFRLRQGGRNHPSLLGVLGRPYRRNFDDLAIWRGDIDSGSFSIWWLWSERLIAAFVMNRSEDEYEVAPEWVRFQQKVPLELLENPDLALNAPYPAAGEARTRGS